MITDIRFSFLDIDEFLPVEPLGLEHAPLDIDPLQQVAPAEEEEESVEQLDKAA